MMAQTATADKSASLSSVLIDLQVFVLASAQTGATFHDFEHELWQRLLCVGRNAVGLFLDAQGTGDLGETFTLPEGQQLRRLEQTHDRELTSVFGSFTLQRTCYGSREGQAIPFVPLDNRLALPQGKFS
jgi:hypothetical protein